MNGEIQQKDFAPSGREGQNTVLHQYGELQEADLYKGVIDAMPQNFLILNDRHQVVYANKAVTAYLNTELNQILGKRPGELLQCVNCSNTPSGCGTCRECLSCGALDAIIQGLKGEEVLKECRIRLSDARTLNLNVWIRPLELNHRRYIIMILFDLTSQKKKDHLEQVFFHDMMNTAGGILGYTQHLKDTLQEEKAEEDRQTIQTLEKLIRSLVDQINEQKEITNAEESDLIPSEEDIQTLPLLKDIVRLFTDQESARGKTTRISEQAEDFLLRSDPVIVHRILSNMIINALEASAVGDIIELNCRCSEDTAELSIANPGFIPQVIQSQIFQRSFSTKGTGRGQGTYGMKLLSNKYLKGDVTFRSTPEEGTVFYLRLPCKELPREQEVEYRVEEHRVKHPGNAILVIGIDQGSRDIIRYILDIQGFESCITPSLPQAMELLKNRPVRMILLDTGSRNDNGIEAFRIIRSHKEYDQIPVIAISTMPTRQTPDIFGMDDIIQKPFNTEQINGVISKWIKRQ